MSSRLNVPALTCPLIVLPIFVLLLSRMGDVSLFPLPLLYIEVSHSTLRQPFVTEWLRRKLRWYVDLTVNAVSLSAS